MRRALTLVTAAMLGACYHAHEREVAALDAFGRDVPSMDAGATVDAGTDTDAWSAPDASTWDGGPCRYPHSLGRHPCTPDLWAECRGIASWLGGGRYGRATCIQIGDGVHEQYEAFCSLGDDCRYDAGVQCRCALDQYCRLDEEVCVSDTPDGAAYCTPICRPRP